MTRKNSSMLNYFRAYDGFLEIFSTVGLSTLTIILFVSQGWADAGALVTTGVFDFIKSHVITAGEFNLTNTLILVGSAVLSFGDNVYLWLTKK